MLSLIGVYYKSKLPFRLIILILIFFSGFRYNVGTDYISYTELFKYGYVTNEIGYWYFIKFIKAIGGTQQLVFFIFSALTISLISKFILKYSPLPYLSLLTYIGIAPFFLASLSGIRQQLAIAIFLYVLQFIKSRNINSFLAYIIFGVLFAHVSLLFVIPLYYFIHKKLSPKTILIIILISIFSGRLIDLLSNYTVYAMYIDSSYDITVSGKVYFFLFIACVLMFFRKNEINIFINLNLLSIVCLILLIVNEKLPDDLFLRMNSYFFFSQLILIPYLLSKIKGSVDKLISISLFVLLICTYFINNTLIKGGEYNLTPYSFNFELF